MSTTQDEFAEQAASEDTNESVGSNHEGQEGRCPCHLKQAHVVCKVYLTERIMPSRNAYWCKDRLSRDFWIGFLKKVNAHNSTHKFTLLELLTLIKELSSYHGNGLSMPGHSRDVTNAFSRNPTAFGAMIVPDFSNWEDHSPVTASHANDNITEIGGPSGSKKSDYSSTVDVALNALQSLGEIPVTTLVTAFNRLHGLELAWFAEASRSDQIEWLTCVTPRSGMPALEEWKRQKGL